MPTAASQSARLSVEAKPASLDLTPASSPTRLTALPGESSTASDWVAWAASRANFSESIPRAEQRDAGDRSRRGAASAVRLRQRADHPRERTAKGTPVSSAARLTPTLTPLALPLRTATKRFKLTALDLKAFTYHVMVSPRHKFVMFTIPKVSCTEFIRLFFRMQGGIGWHRAFLFYLAVASVPAPVHSTPPCRELAPRRSTVAVGSALQKEQAAA